MKSKAIIFGSGGQDGQYFTKFLEILGIEVLGVDRNSNYRVEEFDLVQQMVQEVRPSFIFHLAANSSTSHEHWRENHETIVNGTMHLLEAVRLNNLNTKLFFCGSGLQFVNTGRPIHERDNFEATSAYALSRIQSVNAARYYRNLGIKAYVGYLFNHDSPLRSERHINMKIVKTAQRIANGSGEKLQVGDPMVQKEFGFAGDIIKGIWQLVSQDEIFEATIGTGKSFTIQYWAEKVFSYYGLNVYDHLERKNDYIPEYKILVSDSSTINRLGWRHETDLETLVEMMCLA